MLNPVAMSIITNTFTEPTERARAIGVWGAVVGHLHGPRSGRRRPPGLPAGWRSIFWINIPVGLAAIVLAVRFIPESKAPQSTALRPGRAGAHDRVARRHSPSGSSRPRITAGPHRPSSPASPGRDRPRRFDPLRAPSARPTHRPAVLPLHPVHVGDDHRRGGLRRAGGFLFLNTLYLQEVRGLSPLQAGLDTLPMAAMTVIGRPSRDGSSATVAPAFRSSSSGIA